MQQQISRPGAISALVTECVRDILTRLGEPLPQTLDTTTTLVGRGAVLDSLGLVMAIVEIEQRLEEEFALSVTLADERAMSQKRSPFRDIAALSAYIGELIEAEPAHE